MYFGYNPIYSNPYAMKMNTMNQANMINPIRPMNPVNPIQPINMQPQPAQPMINRNNYGVNHMNYSISQSTPTSNNFNNKQRNRFSKEEDECLRILVEKQDENIDWNYISSKMAGRTSRQCRERYRNYLRPNLENGSWTEEEDDLLEQMYEKYGPQWSKIANFFPKRSDVNIKNHHTCIINRLSRQKKRKNSIRSPIRKENIPELASSQVPFVPPMQPIMNQINMPIINPIMENTNPIMMNQPSNQTPLNITQPDPLLIPQNEPTFDDVTNSPSSTTEPNSSTKSEEEETHQDDGETDDFFNKIDFAFGEFKFDDFAPQGELSTSFGNMDFAC